MADLAYFYRHQRPARRASRSSAAGPGPGSPTPRGGSSTPASPGARPTRRRPAGPGLHAVRAQRDLPGHEPANPVPDLTRAADPGARRRALTSWSQVPGSPAATRSCRSRSTRRRRARACSSPCSSTSPRPRYAPAHVHRLRAGARLHRRHARGLRLCRPRVRPRACTPSRTRACRARARRSVAEVPGAPHARVRHARAPAAARSPGSCAGSGRTRPRPRDHSRYVPSA